MASSVRFQPLSRTRRKILTSSFDFGRELAASSMQRLKRVYRPSVAMCPLCKPARTDGSGSGAADLNITVIEHEHVRTAGCEHLDIRCRGLPLWASERFLNCGEVVEMQSRDQMEA
jgi:hypothetical protein